MSLQPFNAGADIRSFKSFHTGQNSESEFQNLSFRYKFSLNLLAKEKNLPENDWSPKRSEDLPPVACGQYNAIFLISPNLSCFSLESSNCKSHWLCRVDTILTSTGFDSLNLTVQILNIWPNFGQTWRSPLKFYDKKIYLTRLRSWNHLVYSIVQRRCFLSEIKPGNRSGKRKMISPLHD